MKKLTAIFILSFSIAMFSLPSYAVWTIVGVGNAENNKGDKFYVDLQKIKKYGDESYFWVLSDHMVPIDGFLSSKGYWHADCKIYRYKYLNALLYVDSMGRGEMKDLGEGDGTWLYPAPDSVGELILDSVCKQ